MVIGKRIAYWILDTKSSKFRVQCSKFKVQSIIVIHPPITIGALIGVRSLKSLVIGKKTAYCLLDTGYWVLVVRSGSLLSFPLCKQVVPIFGSWGKRGGTEGPIY